MTKKDKYIIRVVAVLFLVIGTTFAYFVAQSNKGANALFKVTAHSVDDFKFTISKNISLTMNQFNFASGSGNISDEVAATVELKANNSTNQASHNYNVAFYILENPFEYSSIDHKPELILTVTDPTGAEVKSIEGLTYYDSITNADGISISGFDITTKSGLISVASDSITSSSSTVATTKKWIFKITIINLDINQSINQNKKMNARIVMKKDGDVGQTLAEACTLANFSNCIKENYNLDLSINYHNTSLTNGASDNSYRYSGGDYELTKKATSAGYKYLRRSTSSSADGLIHFFCNNVEGILSDGCSPSYSHYYTLAYDSQNIQYDTFSEVLNKAISDGYLTKDNVSNFVCFGSYDDVCSTDNLYRIIGVFDNQIKLIKYDYATKEMLGDSKYIELSSYYSAYASFSNPVSQYSWNSSNRWSVTNLNKINLNTNFLNYLGNNWTKYIADGKWIVGGFVLGDIMHTSSVLNKKTPFTLYQSEIISPADDEVYTSENGVSKIGLMYASDYGYAFPSKLWTTTLSSDIFKYSSFSNWMYMGLNEMTLLRNANSDFKKDVCIVISSGGVSHRDLYSGYYSVRPVFYLNSDVVLVGGTGTMSDPYIID